MFNEIDDGFLKNNYKLETNEDLKIAFFDMDHTLIEPKSGKVHPKDENDWKIIYYDKKNHDILENLKIISNNGFQLVIITNQKVISLGKTTIRNKIINVTNYIKN